MSEEKNVQTLDATLEYSAMRAVLYNLLPYTLGRATTALEDSANDARLSSFNPDRAAILTPFLTGVGVVAQGAAYYLAYKAGVDPRLFAVIPLATNIMTRGYRL